MRLKKSLGQHFLTDQQYILDIADAVPNFNDYGSVVEVGPGMGAITKQLIKQPIDNFYCIELDDRFVVELPEKFPVLKDKIFHESVLDFNFSQLSAPTCMVGNFPYNISSQIIFKVLENRDQITTMVGMFQKEVAKRITASPGTKDYGILSVLTQAYYDTQYLFDIPAEAFDPPPKVISGIARIDRNSVHQLPVSDANFKRVVKMAFNQRRKMLRNSLSTLITESGIGTQDWFTIRPDRLTVADFIQITQQLLA